MLESVPRPNKRTSPGLTPGAPPGRLALSKAEAAQTLGVSVDFLERHILGELRVVRVGRRRLIAVGELERWLERHGERAPAANAAGLVGLEVAGRSS